METAVNLHVRWTIRKDLPSVVDIEELCFEFPWTETEIIDMLRKPHVIGKVVEYQDGIGGFMFYTLHRTRLHVENIAVHPDYRRCGIGTAMVETLKSKLSPIKRTSLALDVRESNLDAQLFFRHNGFKAVKVIRDAYEDTDEDAYRFAYQIGDDEWT